MYRVLSRAVARLTYSAMGRISSAESLAPMLACGAKAVPRTRSMPESTQLAAVLRMEHHDGA